MKVECGKRVMSLSQSHKRYDISHRMVTSLSQCVTGSHMTGNMKTIGSEVHNHNSSCIYSVENQMETLSSSPC